MPETPKIDRELAGWIERWHNGELDESSAADLVARLETDPRARRAFIEATRFEAMLQLEFPDTVVHIPRARPAWYRRALIPLAAAAAAAFFVSLPHLYWNRRADMNSDAARVALPANNHPSSLSSKIINSTPVARVDSVNNLVLDQESMRLNLGDLLLPGRIHLRSGDAELTFFSGARVSIKGPCVFDLMSDFRASLSEGSITTQVPKEAIGFTVLTPTGQLRDLGTSFALNVDSKGVSDVHVLEGEVEAASGDGASVATLGVNQASRITGDKLVPIKFTPDGWPERPQIISDKKLPDGVHWSFDRFQGDQTLDARGVHPLWLRGGHSKETPWKARICRGIRGPGLNFNGDGEFAESTYRGVSGSKPRSVSLWVCIPPDASAEYPNGILSWGTHEQSRKWQVCWNNGDQGTIGALRVEFGDGYLIGTTDLRDGRWHNVCAVFLGGSGSDVASHMKLYVDGRLETLSGRRSQFIRTDTESPRAVAVTLGRWLGHWPGKEPFYYRGSIDEVYIFDVALLPSQVAALADSARR